MFILSISNLDSITYLSHYEKVSVVPRSGYRYKVRNPNDKSNGDIDMVEYHVNTLPQYQDIVEKIVRIESVEVG